MVLGLLGSMVCLVARPAWGAPPAPAGATPAPATAPVTLAPNGTPNAPTRRAEAPAGKADAGARAEAPKAPEVDDPMLAPLPAAPRTLKDWNDARSLLRTRSTDLAIAVADVERAEGQARVALAAALPTINGNVTATHNMITNQATQPAGLGGPEGTTPIFRTFTTPWPDTLTGQIVGQVPLLNVRAWYGIGTARKNVKAAKLSTEDVKRTLVLGLASAVVSVYTAERVAELNRIALRNALERLALTERRQTLGAGNGLDVVRAQQDAEATRSTLVSGDESLRQARESLGLALGFPQAIGVPQNMKLDDIAKGALSSCKTTDTVDSRADVAALKTRAEVGARNVNDVRWQFLPTISGSSTVSTNSLPDRVLGFSPRTQWNVQALLTIPIWDGGARYGNLRDTNAQLDQALMRLEAQRRKATIEAVQALRSVAVSENNLRVSEKTRDLALENDRLTRASYAEGRGTSLELVTSATTLRQSEINLAVREFELVRARISAALVLSVCDI